MDGYGLEKGAYSVVVLEKAPGDSALSVARREEVGGFVEQGKHSSEDRRQHHAPGLNGFLLAK
jgi:hypothetical protein